MRLDPADRRLLPVPLPRLLRAHVDLWRRHRHAGGHPPLGPRLFPTPPICEPCALPLSALVRTERAGAPPSPSLLSGIRGLALSLGVNARRSTTRGIGCHGRPASTSRCADCLKAPTRARTCRRAHSHAISHTPPEWRSPKRTSTYPSGCSFAPRARIADARPSSPHGAINSEDKSTAQPQAYAHSVIPSRGEREARQS
eukprot:6184066-Pleurochrysis_carterae.AAC.6